MRDSENLPIALLLVVCAVLVVVVAALTYYGKTARVEPPESVAKQIAVDSYDDGKNLVLFRVGVRTSDADTSIYELVEKKLAWEARHPGVEVLAASFVSGDCGTTYGHTCVHGLLITYRAPAPEE